MVKEKGEAIYNTASTVAKTLGYDEKTTGISYKSLPSDIKNDLSSDYFVPQEISAITRYKFSLATKLGYSLNSYFNGLTKILGLAVAAIDGTKKAVAEAVIEAVAYEAFDYTGNETGTYSLIIYDTLNLAKDIGFLAIDAANAEIVALKGTDWLLERTMDRINKDMHKAFEDLLSLNPNSTNRLELYAVFIDAKAKDNAPGAKGVRFYYLNEASSRWLKYYDDIIYWVVEFEPDKEMIAKSTETTVKEYETTAAQTEKTQETAKEEITTVETAKEISQGPVTVYINPAGTGDYKTLEEAIDAVSAGSTIFLDSGTYRISDFSITIDKPLEILGTRMDLTEVVIEDYALRLQGSALFNIEDITFKHSDNRLIIEVENAEVHFKNCRFINGDTGLFLKGSAKGFINNCEFLNNDRGISLWDQSEIEVYDSTFNDNDLGIRFNDDSIGTVNNSTFLNNEFHGILVSGNSKPKIEYNVCSDNDSGITYWDNSGGIAYRNELTGNYKGISLSDFAKPDIEENKITNNSTGIDYYGNNGGTAVGNNCSDNSAKGISVHWESNPWLEDNICNNNGGTGIDYAGRSGGTASGNECSYNEDGIEVHDSSNPILKNNICNHNKDTGIIFFNGTSGEATYNECGNNLRGIYIAEDANPYIGSNDCYSNQYEDIYYE